MGGFEGALRDDIGGAKFFLSSSDNGLLSSFRALLDTTLGGGLGLGNF